MVALSSEEEEPRQCKSWIKDFLDFTKGTAAPEIFRKWAAASTVASALERKVWVRFNGLDLHPHLFILLVGGPGVGKTDALRRVLSFARKLKDVHVAPTSVSRASLTDALLEASRTIIRPGQNQTVVTFNSLLVCAAEFGTFLTAYEGEFMSTLNHLWDGIYYDEKKRHMKKDNKLVIENPQLNLIAGTTPSWLITNLPPQAWSEGFSSRLVMVHSSKTPLNDPFVERVENIEIERRLTADLFDIHNMFGVMKFDRAAQAALREWYLEGQTPVPTHPKLEHYLTRRATHLVKLCMVMSAQRASDYIILEQDFRNALEMLLEAEASIPMIFREMSTGGDSSIMDEVYQEVERIFSKNSGGVPEARIIEFISRRIRANDVKRIFEVMYTSNMLRIVNASGMGGRPTYAPVPRNHHNMH